ncbi:BpuSI family type II restriction endonuclease [Pantoea sp. Mb-10]|uniref:BpuSI family type II restriction endonuclease n=1 Tax=unclassified Pantoea TaxID=2630326 RepID=UPI001E478317|nr:MULTISPECIES: BpuSI family type II restriction endonuclease [unclassified Pantoea]MCE0490341.1 BpuSI family type II restriction endonuclease [Pantoea sp. Mb-10]MCE0501472.1 BpuSI family type II restriction endonuclease [Pantoea sp. Pb-8]
MPWLDYNNDEVRQFHPEFKSVADNVLVSMGISSGYHWEHHPSSYGVQVIPDFVLVESATNRWVLVVEIKRTKAAVFSERNQVQAKGYAEANRLLYSPGKPGYFCVTNMEVTLLFALNESNPPKDCRILGMTFDSGNFVSESSTTHRKQFAHHLSQIINHVINTHVPVFELVWPRIVRSMISYSEGLPYDLEINLSGGKVPQVVANYFSGGPSEAPRRELLLRCLSVEYFKGVLEKFHHPLANQVPSLKGSVSQVGNAIDELRRIDFSGVFESEAASLYRKLEQKSDYKSTIELFIKEIRKAHISRLAATRADVLEFPDILISESYSLTVQDARGKAQTDPDLSALLAALAISDANKTVFDPGCGDGSLLSAAYDLLRLFGLSHADVLSRIHGIDADALATKIAAIRLVLKEPYVLSRQDPCNISAADMFSSAQAFNGINVVLMNPPFKRYEAQDQNPIPQDLREYFYNCIDCLGGITETAAGQANLYNLYVEFVIKACDEGTTLGIILDNRWYHNSISIPLRSLILRECTILALVEYPHKNYFSAWTIATSILVISKGTAPTGHNVQFLRSFDPMRADFMTVGAALRGQCAYPSDWSVQYVSQQILEAKTSWKAYFSPDLQQEYRSSDWPNLEQLFASNRRGSLAKEGGGIAIYEFPFDRTNYGPRRSSNPNRKRYETTKGAPLTKAEQVQLRHSASQIPQKYRGYALQNSDHLSGYRLTIKDVIFDETLEAPLQRETAIQASYWGDGRRVWDADLDSALAEFKANVSVAKYIHEIEQIVGLDETVLPSNLLWNALREPFAGELIVPRKLRKGHRVHINPFPFTPHDRQVRLSSNFLSYGDCQATDVTTGLTREIAVELIAAFLMSSFGWLQCEIVSVNREGVRSLEQSHVRNIRIFDPRWVRSANRAAIIKAAHSLQYPLRTDCSPFSQPDLQALDNLFAEEIVARNPALQTNALLQETWQALSEWLEARNP